MESEISKQALQKIGSQELELSSYRPGRNVVLMVLPVLLTLCIMYSSII